MANKRLLVVDDEQAILDMLTDMFEFLEIDADLVPSGIKALEMIREDPEKYNVVMLDLYMPDCDGRDTFHEMIKIAPELKIYIVSGYGSGEITDELVEAGAAGVIPKPFNIEKIQNIIEAG
ncbi:response regulator [bacterium]|nr:response regulator [bacterium]